jgi:hypothetical protein
MKVDDRAERARSGAQTDEARDLAGHPGGIGVCGRERCT